MFYALSKILGYFVLPLSVALVALVAFWVRNRRREKPRWCLLWVAIVVLWFGGAPWGSDLLLLPLERPYANLPPPTQADVIVVLGGSLDLVGSEEGRLQYHGASDRFVNAVLLARQFPRARVIFAGGTASLENRVKSEAKLLRGEAVRLGIEPERIFTDDISRNTRENAQEAQRLLQQTGGKQVVLVTSAFHMRRSLACFRQVGVQTTPYPVDFRGHFGVRDSFGWMPLSDRLMDSTSAVREYVGLVVYRLKGWTGG